MTSKKTRSRNSIKTRKMRINEKLAVKCSWQRTPQYDQLSSTGSLNRLKHFFFIQAPRGYNRHSVPPQGRKDTARRDDLQTTEVNVINLSCKHLITLITLSFNKV